MKKLVTVMLGFSAAGALILFPAKGFAHKGEPDNTAKAIAKAMKHPLVVHGGKAAQLKIVHVQRGCHVWSAGTKKAKGAKLFLGRGGHLTVLNQDIDMHKVVRLAGPKIPLGGYVMMNHRKTVTFTKAGTYKLRTRTVEMEGMVDVKTIGPDNPLPLYVVVKQP